MEHPAHPEVTFHHAPGGDETVKRIIRTTVLLSVITLIELGLGLAMYAWDMGSGLVLFIKGTIVILSLAKAFYIVSVFMHLGDEVRNLIMTIVVPLMLFVWFIAAFLWDGDSWRTLRNTEGRSKPATEQKAPVPDAKKPGGVE
jgi:cytochrome c oxidase subunit IV